MNYQEEGNPDFYYNNLRTPQKSSSGKRDDFSNNLYEQFNENVKTNLKQISFDELISLSTTKKELNNITNEDIINELQNKISYYNQILRFKESQKEVLENELFNFRKWFVSYFQKITNFNELTFDKIKRDYNELKLEYESKLLSNSSKEEWEYFQNMSNNFFDYIHLVLDKVNFDSDIGTITAEIMKKAEKIDLDEVNVEGIKKTKKVEFNNLKSSFDSDTKKAKAKPGEVCEVILYKNYDNFTESKFVKCDESQFHQLKQHRLKYVNLKIYFSKKEDLGSLMKNIEEIKGLFKKYIVTFSSSGSSPFVKFCVCGITKRRCRLKKTLLKIITENLKHNCVIRRIYFSKQKYTIQPIIKKLYENKKYNYYTSNFSQASLNRNL